MPRYRPGDNLSWHRSESGLPTLGLTCWPCFPVVNICKLYCSSPVHFREPLTNHARCSSDKQCYNWASIPGREVRACRGQTDVRLLCWRLLARAEPTENKRRAQSIISYSPLPRFFDFKTFNARIINGSTPFSISVFL